jgi:DinB superfamily
MTRFILMTAALACAAYGQGGGRGGPTTTASDIKAKYNAIKTNVTNAADQMPEAAYGFMPEGEPRSFAGWLAHIVDSQAGTCGPLAGTPTTLGAAAMTGKADLIAALKKSYDLCDTAYNAVTDENANEGVAGRGGAMQPRLVALYGNIIHINECYGAMAVYMRLQKLTPPSSAGRGGGRGMPGGGPGGAPKQ